MIHIYCYITRVAGQQWCAGVAGGDTCGDTSLKRGNICTLLCPKSIRGVGEDIDIDKKRKVYLATCHGS